MQQEFLRHVNHLPFDVAGNYRIKRAGRVSELKRARNESHGAEVTSPGDNFDVHLLLGQVAVLLGNEKRHHPHRIIRHADFELPHLRISDISMQEQKHHRQPRC